MDIKVSEISSLIAKEIKDFKKEIDYSNDVGTVVTIGDGIALLYGLDSAGLCSIIGSLASVINLRLYCREMNGKGNAFNFIKTFTWISLVFFAIVVIPQFLLIR